MSELTKWWRDRAAHGWKLKDAEAQLAAWRARYPEIAAVWAKIEEKAVTSNPVNLTTRLLKKAAEHAEKMSRHGVTIRLCFTSEAVMVIGTHGQRKTAAVIPWEEVEAAANLIAANPVAAAVTTVYNELTKKEKANGAKAH